MKIESMKKELAAKASTRVAKKDILAVLETCPHEVTGLLSKIEAGEMNGTCYIGECKCLLGTLAALKLGPENTIKYLGTGIVEGYGMLYWLKELTRMPNSRTPAEMWFYHIRKNDTPANNVYASLASDWIKKWLGSKGMLK